MKAYTTAELFERAKEIIPKYKLIFIEDVCAYLGLAKSTFYIHIPLESNESNELRELLEKNKIDIKIGLRKKWFDSDNATLQMALYKLTSTDTEHKKLQQNYIADNEDKEIKLTIEVVDPVKNEGK